VYSHPDQLTPYLLFKVPPATLEAAAEVTRNSMRLTSAAHPTARAALRELVRSMNSYYSNRIEGQGTHPLHIERALRREFSDRPDVARLQRIAVAHIEAERELESLHPNAQEAAGSAFLQSAHKALYSRLDKEDRLIGEDQEVVPGEIRTVDVKVGRHIPPEAAALPRFLARMDKEYASPMGWDGRLIAAACAHHRAAWIHPFTDGNGRAVRLQTHCVLWELSDGLWSISRGLARARDQYYARLANAGQPRRGDLDGRGNLTTAGLVEWVDFFVQVCLDQVQFMTRMLELDGLKRRIEALVTYRATEDKDIRREAVLPLHHVFAAGPVARGEFIQMTGLGERTGRKLLSRLLHSGLLVSDSHVAPVRIGLPLDALSLLFPELYPEAATKPD
jgi:Fic family protein